MCYSLDPILVQSSPAGVKLLCGQFAFNASVVVTGDDDGCVAVYGLRGFEQHPDDQVDWVKVSGPTWYKISVTFFPANLLANTEKLNLKPGLHQQQCRSNTVEATGNFVACCFDIVAVFW